MQIRVRTAYYVYYLPISVLHLLHGKIEHEKKNRSDELSLIFSIGIENCLASLIVISLIARCYDLLQWTR